MVARKLLGSEKMKCCRGMNSIIDEYNWSQTMCCYCGETEDEDGEEVTMDERELHTLAEDVLQQLLRERFSAEFDKDDGTTFEVDCEIISVSENR